MTNALSQSNSNSKHSTDFLWEYSKSINTSSPFLLISFSDNTKRTARLYCRTFSYFCKQGPQCPQLPDGPTTYFDLPKIKALTNQAASGRHYIHHSQRTYLEDGILKIMVVYLDVHPHELRSQNLKTFNYSRNCSISFEPVLKSKLRHTQYDTNYLQMLADLVDSHAVYQLEELTSDSKEKKANLYCQITEFKPTCHQNNLAFIPLTSFTSNDVQRFLNKTKPGFYPFQTAFIPYKDKTIKALQIYLRIYPLPSAVPPNNEDSPSILSPKDPFYSGSPVPKPPYGAPTIYCPLLASRIPNIKRCSEQKGD